MIAKIATDASFVSAATVATIPVGGDPVTGAIASIVTMVIMKLLEKWLGRKSDKTAEK